MLHSGKIQFDQISQHLPNIAPAVGVARNSQDIEIGFPIIRRIQCHITSPPGKTLDDLDGLLSLEAGDDTRGNLDGWNATGFNVAADGGRAGEIMIALCMLTFLGAGSTDPTGRMGRMDS